MTNGSDGSRVSPAHTSAQSLENAFLFLAVLSQGLLCPSGKGKGKLCLGFWRALMWVGGTGGVAVGARMLLLVSAKKKPAWSCLSCCTGPEMERPGEVCPQAKRASSFLPSLPPFSKCFEKLTPKS